MNIFQLFSGGSSNMLGSLFTLLAFVFVISLVLREIFTWYWKINEIISLLKKIEENTSKSSHLNTQITEQHNQQNLPDKDARTSMLDPRMNWK